MSQNRREFLSVSVTAAMAMASAGRAPAQTAKQDSWKPKPYRRIATEEAFSTPEIAAAGPGGSLGGIVTPYRKLINEHLMDLGEGRLKIMDEYGISMQVLSSNGPSLQDLPADKAQPLTRDFNDRMADAVRKHPTRYVALAGVAPQDPDAAAKEIDRCLSQLKFNGAFIAGYTNGEYLDEPKYAPIFEVLTQHDAPLYLHP